MLSSGSSGPIPMSQTKNIFPIKGNILQQISVMLQILRLYLPNILLIATFALAFLNLSQGADVLTKTSENTRWYPGIFVLVALFFWVYVVWYSGRIIAYLENELFLAAPGLLFHLPRLLGFYIYALFVIAFLNTPALLGASLNAVAFISLLAAYGILYWQLNLWIRALSVLFRKKYGTIKFSRICGTVFWLNPVVIIICGLIRESNFSMIIGASLLQFIFIFLVINRRNIREIGPAQKPMEFMENMLEPIFKRAQGKIPRFEEFTFAVFNLVSVLALIIYCLAIFCLPFSIAFGTLGVILLALGFYSGLYNLLKMFSMIYRIRLSFFLFILMLTGGFIFEPHNIQVLRTGPNQYDQRMNFREYVYNWLQLHEQDLTNDSIAMVPVIMVHADGGASRSGFWTASVLGKLDNVTGEKFSRNLFALSGASGGSVGNSTFFALLYLRNKEESAAAYIKKNGMIQPAMDFLKTDFLTFTLARLLGPDCFNAIYPFTADRARALEYSMEYGAGKGVLLDGFFARPFSGFVTKHTMAYNLPVLFINTTRMQDGLPGVISNIRPDPAVFGRRLDVLALLPAGEDIRFSTAVVLGARFPYLSPAGCITRMQRKADGTIVKERHYFVDGGYFDNSGAGVIHETIMEMNRLIHNDSVLSKKYGTRLNKLRFIVIHITNTPYSVSNFKKALPFNNDLAAPLLTLAGSYSSQTSVNNSRLENYMRTLYFKDNLLAKAGLNQSYYEINLYSNNSEETYAMNWSISDATLKRMQSRLENNYKLDTLINQLKRLLQ
jgi:hypothetical protein